LGLPSGYTRTPEIRAELDKYESATNLGGLVRFWGLDGAGATRLVELLPATVASLKLEGGPALRDWAELGSDLDGILFEGHRIDPSRPDELIVIEGVYIPESACSPEIINRLKAWRPSELEWVEVGASRRYLHAWWD
jgi:hypothetical protein